MTKPTKFAALGLLSIALLTNGLSGCATSTVLNGDQITAIVNSPDRSEADRTNDLRRKPVQVLEFIGVKRGMIALDLNAGGGYTTELLARAVGPDGRVFGQSAPRPAGATLPPGRRTTPDSLAARAKASNLNNINSVVQPFENPAPADYAHEGLDLVTLMFNYHDLTYQPFNRSEMNHAVFAALKHGGIYVIADHAANPGTGISVAKTLHRIEESTVRSEVEAAGFKLLAAGDFLRNPADPHDNEEAPTGQKKDEFVLKFVKP